MCEKQCLASQNDDLSVSDKNAPETQGNNELKRKTRAFCLSKPMYYSVYYYYSVSLLDMVGLEPSKKILRSTVNAANVCFKIETRFASHLHNL